MSRDDATTVDVPWRGRVYRVYVLAGQVIAVDVQLTPRAQAPRRPGYVKGWRPLPLAGNVARTVAAQALQKVSTP